MNELPLEQNLSKIREEGLELLLDFEKGDGLIPVVTQDYTSGQVLMLAYANEIALQKTIETGYATYWSRDEPTRQPWYKGAKSGNRLILREILVDCDQDALIYLVEREKGGACHTKNSEGTERMSCFYRRYNQQTGKLEFVEVIL